MRLWPKQRRRKAIAIAEAHLREAGIGKPELMDAEHVTFADNVTAILDHIRSRGRSNWVFNTMKAHLALQPPPTGWRVSFWVYDERYIGGADLVIVTVDDITGLPHLPPLRASYPAHDQSS
jgi:hypothetical protein